MPVYFDHAATSHPKPASVGQAIAHYLSEIGASPGRSSHTLSRLAESAVDAARRTVAEFLGVADPEAIAYTSNATHGLNLVLKGLLRRGDHVVLTSFEHNSVLRPLHRLKDEIGVELTVVSSDRDGSFDLNHFEEAVQPNTKLFVANHASNVIGVVSPIQHIAAVARRHGARVLVDGSQTAGFLPIDLDTMDCDYFVFTGHKSLLGPSGIGGVFVRDPDSLATLMEGGTGSNSHSLYHPEVGPERFHAGTVNYLGLVGLAAGIDDLRRRSIDTVRRHELALTAACIERLDATPSVTVFGSRDIDRKVPVISFTVDGILPTELAHKLDREHGIMTRAGLQCAPLVHRSIGTAPRGTVRVSFGADNQLEEVERLVEAVRFIAVGLRSRRAS